MRHIHESLRGAKQEGTIIEEKSQGAIARAGTAAMKAARPNRR
jgi:hypothetical protein